MTTRLVNPTVTSTAPNGPEVVKTTKLDTSDSATPETGDEADDERLEGPSQPESASHSAIQKEVEEEKKDSSGPSAVASSSSTEEVRLKPLSEEGEVVVTPLSSRPDMTQNKSTRSAVTSGKGTDVDDDAERYHVDGEPVDSDSEDVSQKEESVLWKLRMKCGAIVNNEYIQITIISLIIINALIMGIATMDFVTDNPSVDEAFTTIDRVFLVIFTVEVAMQLFYLGLTLFADGWLVFDLLIVIFSWSFESLQIVRAFRIFRAFRLITRVKPLRDLVLAIGAVLPRMYAIAALLLLIFYIFSVLFTELFSELPLSENYFGTLDASLFTCMEMMTLEWGEIAREVMEHENYAWAPFLCFILITGFIVFNLIVAVVCDAVAVTEKTVRELDGLDSDDPERTLEEAQERIDLLQCHISDMQRTQQSVQDMIEMLAGELLHLETEKMKAENREADLRLEMERRVAYQKDMESSSQIASLERNYLQEKDRRESERRLRTSRSSEDLAARIQRRLSASSKDSGRPGFDREMSARSGSSKSSREARRKAAAESPRTSRTNDEFASDVDSH